jgi:hypothetical protein
MELQLDIDFSRRENNKDSQAILDANKERFKGQCKTLYTALLRGERLTTATALLRYGIGDLRRRIADLIEAGVPVEKKLIDGRFKEYFIKKAS